MTSPSAGRARWLALGTLLVVGVLAVLVIARSQSTYDVEAVFDQVNGLVRGGEVRAGGLKVGSVDDITLGRDGLPHVRMHVSTDFRLRRGAVAEMRLFSLAGEVNRYVALHQGTGEELPDGATLGLAHTDQPVEIDQVLSTLDPATRADVRGLLMQLDRATRGRGADLGATIAHSAQALGQTAQLLRDVRGDGDALRQVLRNGRQVVGALAAHPDDLGATVDELAALLRTTASRQAALAAGVEHLPAGLRSPRLALDRTDAAVGRLRALVRDARPAVHALVPFAGDLRGALRAARPTLRQAGALVARAPAQLRALRPLLRAAPPTLERLAPVLGAANPMLDQIRVRLPDFFSFFSNWADFTSNYDANGHAAHVGLVMAPAPVNPIGPSDDGAGSMSAPFVRTPGALEGEPWEGYRDSFVGGGEQP